ncbi:PAS domain S-box protein [Methanolacinia paynteri]|uniref:PAS domain S-box protein n=1 Tax=Methanolacinia paynteri TaxID=230356 RepID=UPI000A0434BE|nr:PAS domain S-box protein [Methanolacinia paynteri]
MIPKTWAEMGCQKDSTQKSGEINGYAPLNRALRLIIDNASNPVIITDERGRIIYNNPAALQFIFMNPQSAEPHIHNLKFAGDYGDILAVYDYNKDEGCIWTEDVELLNTKGEKRTLKLKISVFFEDSESQYCFHMVDLTDKILSEKALKKSEMDKTLILNSVHENLVYYDKNYRIIWANQQPADSVGLTPAEMKGRFCYELWYNRDSPCPDCTIKKAMESHQPLIEEKVKPDGRNVKVAAYPVFSEKGGLIGAVESVLDISRRKKAEMALDEILKKYRELFTTMTNGFVLHEIITDDSGKPYDFRFLDVNPAFEEMTGLFSSEMVGKTVLELFPDYSREWIERYGRVALTGEPEEFSDYNPTFGKYYHIYSYSPKKGQFAAIFSDVTDLVALRKEHNQMMIQINRNFEQLAILNDEIRNPLQVIAGYALMDESNYSEKILSQIHTIDKLINELDKRWLESDKIREYLMKHHNLY